MSSLWSHTQAVGNAATLNTMSAPKPGNNAANRFTSQALAGTSTSPKAAQANASVPADSSSTSSTSGSDTTVTANDFLTLLVTEMQNQDPTADSDPNEYIDQLVQINSLEQLVSINQDLETVLGAAGSGSTSTQTVSSRSTPATDSGAQSSAKTQHAAGKTVPAHTASTTGVRGGNLSMPADSGAANAVAHGLAGRHRSGGGFRAIRDIPSGYMTR